MERVIQGYCLRPHTETNGASGIEKKWTPEVLCEAAETLVGCPVTWPATSNNDVIGEVLYAEYVEGKGVRYEAEIHDADAIEKIEQGLAEPAPRVYHEAIDDTSNEPVEVEDVQFDSLFLTSQPTDAVPALGPPGMEPTERFK